jgi:lipid-binding SYLF domain-containing protein
MEKIQELVKENKLSQTLMADKDFVSKAEEIFKSQNIDIDDKKLKQLTEQIESGLKKSTVLDDKDLEEVSGGVIKKSTARDVVGVVTNLTTMAVGGLLGGAIGANFAHKHGASDYTTSGVAFANAGIYGCGATALIGFELSDWIIKKLHLYENENKAK